MNKSSHPLIHGLDKKGDILTIRFSDEFRYLGLIQDDFWIKQDGVALEGIPAEILLVPLILNIAPVIWVSGESFYLETMDESLYHSLQELKKSLATMYPSMNWDGELKARHLIRTSPPSTSNRASVLFSGGVDSICSSFRHIDEPQILITVRGSDISLNDDSGWAIIKSQTERFAQNYGFDSAFIESNFFTFLNQGSLSSIDRSVPSWWAYVQHGMGLAGLTAIPSYLAGSNVLYIASTHSTAFYDKQWGSHPRIDNLIAWGSLRVIHDSYEITRQQKIRLIVDRTSAEELITPVLRVCYSNSSGDGGNCGKCEKCSRTITSLIVAGVSYQDYGFQIGPQEFSQNVMNSFHRMKFNFDENAEFHWTDIQSHIDHMIDPSSNNRTLAAFLDWLNRFDFHHYRVHYQRSQQRLLAIKSAIKHIPFAYETFRYCKRKLRGILT